MESKNNQPCPPVVSPNTQLLIKTLEALPSLDGRYERIRCVNVDPVRGTKRGCFSIVFRAYDVLEDRDVALKFFDIDPANQVKIYRRSAFHREHTILSDLRSKERCLQLAGPFSAFDLSVVGPGGGTLTIQCEYFPVEWIDEEIDHYFERQQDFAPADKLRLFNEVVLAVQALHRHHVFHRDLKPDNLRVRQRNADRVVVAIDLGTSALYSSSPIQTDYSLPAGAPFYSPLEAFCHLAGDREIAPHADHYALGCMLFELFNLDFFARAYGNRNPNYQVVWAVMEQLLRGASTTADKVRLWTQNIAIYSKGLFCPPLDGPGSTLPKGIAPLLNRVLESLTEVDFTKRQKNLDAVRRTVWSAIRCVENEREYAHRLRLVRERRKRSEDKARLRDQRLQKLLTKRD